MAIDNKFGRYGKKAEVIDLKTKRKIEGGTTIHRPQLHVAETHKIQQERQTRSKQENTDELSVIDGIADEIIKQFGSIPEIRQKAEMMREHIDKDFIKGDVDLVKVKLLHWGGSSERPELHLGLAEWWKNHRKPGNVAHIKS